MTRAGTTLVELLVALAIFGIVSALVGQSLLVATRHLAALTQAVERNSTWREAAIILPEELRGLDAGDPHGSDIVEMATTSLRYRAMRGVYVSCLPPDAAKGTMVLSGAFSGSPSVDPGVDSMLIFAEGSVRAVADNRWLPADVVAVTSGRECPGQAPSVRVQLAGISKSELSVIGVGAPARSFRVAELRSYRDARGVWWLGMQRFQKAAGRHPPVQPVLGPLLEQGVVFRYYDGTGNPAASRGAVGSIGVIVTPGASTGGSGSARLPEALEIRIPLRNNPPGLRDLSTAGH